MATAAQPPQRGMFFEEITEGFYIASQGRTITETDVVVFAGVSGDYNPLHTDESYAKQTVFGGRIAHGLLGLSVASGLAMQLGFMTGTVEAFRELTWKFRLPVLMGDTIHIVATATSKKAIRGYKGGLYEGGHRGEYLGAIGLVHPVLHPCTEHIVAPLGYGSQEKGHAASIEHHVGLGILSGHEGAALHGIHSEFGDKKYRFQFIGEGHAL